ncbi:MAG: GNAT family N-acetyltransferase [Reichenbachiella sp.]|uniref:GNAT family N-acetyltransferase n=1 Tax=Reichenbachiella sp. TaxID=2184521 RepID=UPI003266A8F5
MNKIDLNIDNLTSLWESVSAPFDGFGQQPEFDYALLKDSEWPNRLWLKQDLSEIDLSQLRLQLIHQGSSVKVAHWVRQQTNQQPTFEKAGFELISSQLGMSLSLENLKAFPKEKLTVIPVIDTSTGEIWSELFQEAFGYFIHPKQLILSNNTLAFVYSFEGTPVGTGLIHYTGTVAGIHAIGVPPAHRRNGYAAEIMHHLLNLALLKGCSVSTLQASDLGKALYLKLGYQEDFSIQNYKLRH